VHRLMVSYGQPTDPAAFDAHYRDTHAPLALKMPGLVRFTYGHPQAMDPSSPAPYLVAELDFESEQAMGQAFGTPEGKATAADVGNFATGGASMAHFDVHEAS
jgi:uncharacterized protein (TIGR02118 family)